MLNPPLLLTGHTTLDIIRREAETLVRGRPQPGAETTVQIICNVQPILKSTDTMLLPEADRSKAALKVYTKGAAMRQRKEGPSGYAADRFYWKGDLFEVMKVIDYDMGVLNHYKAICMRIELDRNIYQDLEDSLYNIVDGLHPEWTTIFAYTNASEPLNPYLAIDVRKITQTGSEYSSTPTVGADGVKLIQTTYQNYVAGVRFEFIGKYDDQTSVADMAHTLQLELRSDVGYDLQRANRLSLFNLTALRRLPLRRETEMYMIYQLDVDFAYIGMVTTEQDYATGLQGGGIYHDANRPPDYILETEFEINYP